MLLTTSTYGEVVLSMFGMRLSRPFGLLRVIGVCVTFPFESILWLPIGIMASYWVVK